jgi:hypothetical protein
MQIDITETLSISACDRSMPRDLITACSGSVNFDNRDLKGMNSTSFYLTSRFLSVSPKICRQFIVLLSPGLATESILYSTLGQCAGILGEFQTLHG